MPPSAAATKPTMCSLPDDDEATAARQNHLHSQLQGSRHTVARLPASLPFAQKMYQGNVIPAVALAAFSPAKHLIRKTLHQHSTCLTHHCISTASVLAMHIRTAVLNRRQRKAGLACLDAFYALSGTMQLLLLSPNPNTCLAHCTGAAFTCQS